MSGPEEIAAAVRRLQTGGLVAFPTETVYGLGAPAFDGAAVARVFALKGRPATNPLIVHVSGVDMARRVVDSWPAEAEKLAAAFWPGPLTIVLPRADTIPPIVTAGRPGVAVRCPDHALTLALLETLGEPLVGPSANPSGSISPTTAEHVRASFNSEQVLVLDGGPCRGGIESTVLTLAGEAPRILRPGVIGAAEIEAVIQRRVEDAGGLAAGSESRPLESPGLLSVHYAPRSPAVLVSRAELAQLLGQAGGPVVVVAHERIDTSPPHRLERMPGDARAYAAALYGALRRADSQTPALIAVLRPEAAGPDAHVWRAVLDRLTRATAQRSG